MLFLDPTSCLLYFHQSQPSVVPTTAPVSEGGASYYPISQQHPGQALGQPQGVGMQYYSHPGIQTSGGGQFQSKSGHGGGYFLQQSPSSTGVQSVYGYEGMGQQGPPQVSLDVQIRLVSHCISVTISVESFSVISILHHHTLDFSSWNVTSHSFLFHSMLMTLAFC